MSEKIADTIETTAAAQVDFAIRQLNSLSILPSVGTRFLTALMKLELTPAELTEIIESEPALTAMILSHMHQQGLSFDNDNPSIRRALDKIPLRTLRGTFLSMKVDLNFGQASDRPLSREELGLHSLSVACCAKQIAEIVTPKIDLDSAYLAGLLHNIGNLALYQAMPKSFDQIVGQAKSQGVYICDIQQKYLGLDYTIIGKRLAEKWGFPEHITLAIWLHRCDVGRFIQSMPEVRIAQVVQLADCLARHAGLGQSASFDSPGSTEKIADSLGVTTSQLEQISEGLTEQVKQKFRPLGLDSQNAAKNYCDTIAETASQLAGDNTKLSQENLRMQAASSKLDFTDAFLSNINAAAFPLDIAKNFAVAFQKSYQTGPVCLYLTPKAGLQSLEAVVAESPSQTKFVYLTRSVDLSPIPQAIAKEFTILDAADQIDWLFEQLDADFDLDKTKLLPLTANGKTIAVMAFELNYPVDNEKIEENCKTACAIGGIVLEMASGSSEKGRFAEQFAMALGKPRDVQPAVAAKTTRADEPQTRADSSLTALAEMAAGAAHELNNPLSVVSGRAQLLAESETDPEKKQILKQIHENAGELSGIIDELMSFAEPQQPRPIQTDLKQMLNEAVQLASRKTNTEHVNVQFEIPQSCKDVFVDSAQIASAMANIISNSLESYTDKIGPIKIAATPDDKFVELQISDLGCGMDQQTLAKAIQPFFSAKPAGRKRGMGLTYAARLIESNKGSLNIQSEPGIGTTVTITLPVGQ